MLRLSFTSVLLILLSQIGTSEIIPLQGILYASSVEVHYIRGWVEAPGHVDLTSLSFYTANSGAIYPEDDWYTDDDTYAADDLVNDDDTYENEFDDDTNGEKFDDDFENGWNGQDDQFGDDKVNNEGGTDSPTSGGDPTSAPTSAPSDEASTFGTEGNGSETPAPEGGATSNPSPGDSEGTSAPSSGGTDSASNAGTNEVESQTDPPTVEESPPPTSTPTISVSTLPPTDERRRKRALAGENTEQVMDILLFLLPENCKQSAFGPDCDWSKLGVGTTDYEVNGGVSYCCSEDTVSRGVCSSEQIGRFIVNEQLYAGERRTVSVPQTSDEEFHIENANFDVEITGDYVLILGNCNDYGLDVVALGSMEWKSVNGYLPGEMFGLMFFYAVLTGMYLILVLWYWCGMRMFQDAAIPIQRYILATMIIGLLELFFRSLDLGTWNLDGLRKDTIVWIALILGVLKRAISRCLIVMVSMGWGVVRDSLGGTLVKIVLLGLIYAGLTLVRDFLAVLAVNKVESWSLSTEQELLDLTILVSLGMLAVNLIFYFWIMFSLNATTEYLKNMNQATKLRRHLRLRCLIITAFSFSVVLVIFTIADGILDFLTTGQVWVLEAAIHANYLFILCGVAILWRPNANAKEYALQMELPAMGEDGENELELSCVVPSAGDMDDGNDPDHPNGIPASRGVVS